MERIKNFFKDESGASAVEYGLLVALIAVVIITAVSTLGTQPLEYLRRSCLQARWVIIKRSGARRQGAAPAGPRFFKAARN